VPSFGFTLAARALLLHCAYIRTPRTGLGACFVDHEQLRVGLAGNRVLGSFRREHLLSIIAY
jgi:hypothetical protein